MSQSSSRNIFAVILSILLGVLFLFSAWTKTYPVSDFEYIIKSQLDIPTFWSAVLARAVIGFEFALGFFLLVHGFIKKKWVVIAAILLLVAFSIHLFILYLNVGNDANCGCMGTVVEMSPLPSIFKNVIMIALLFVLLKLTQGSPKVKLHDAFVLFLSILTMGLMFVLFPIKQAKEYLSYHTIYSPEQPEQPSVNLNSGKHIICFMTLGCGHCRDAAKEIVSVSEQHPDLPFYIFLLRPEKHRDSTDVDTLVEVDSAWEASIALQEKDFFEDTKAKHIPHSYLKAKTFISLIEESGNIGTPTILWMRDSTIIREIRNHDFSVKDIKNWLQSK